ncbi:MAG: hypothetical protein Q9201_000658 [Fulgogasparrea decipioides]
MSRTILITGATGKQGRACIEALLSSPSAPAFSILALTRDSSSASAARLAQRSPQIKILQGDLNDSRAIFRSASQPIHGVLGVTTPMGGKEVAHGTGLVDAALEAGVKHFVFTSVDRGGNHRSDTNPTEVPHFRTKYDIEQHLLAKASGTDLMWTVLRPVAFMDNLQPGLLGKLFATAWKVALKNGKLQLIATEDVGWFAAQAFLHPEEYRDRALSLAGDELTFGEADAAFMDKVGYRMPLAYEFLARFGLWLSEDFGSMFIFFRDEGFGADVETLRLKRPEMMKLGDWVEKKRRNA